ncbi:uncharacterized protein LY89DRAFT_457559 [Mollisia scopiformis]|uniref:Uncharacterized protein n=1 Tax=Mollisia scopiformis TaxID=149040 RepID=A0A194XHG3_MOLSC|nr:uncharacterized protein LY89DRAFT_457559 [Mollisia scopiformis]KUJ19655.1 hypothetical protein LY89DRAFT_457559 [Mollisia scopiformis]
MYCWQSVNHIVIVIGIGIHCCVRKSIIPRQLRVGKMGMSEPNPCFCTTSNAPPEVDPGNGFQYCYRPVILFWINHKSGKYLWKKSLHLQFDSRQRKFHRPRKRLENLLGLRRSALAKPYGFSASRKCSLLVTYT